MWILIGLTAVILLGVVAVEIVLATDVPRKWVLSGLEQKLRLRVGAQGFSTTWMGRTHLSDVSFSLPLASESFITARSVRIQHTPVLGLILGRSLSIEVIEIDRPNLLVRQMPDGRWNVQEVAELIRRAGGGSQPQTTPTPPSGVPRLPNVDVNDGMVRIVDHAGRQATLGPLAIRGYAEGPLLWRYKAAVPGQLEIAGDVAPGATWAHRLDIQVAKLAPAFQSYLSPGGLAVLNSLQLRAHWTGQVDSAFTGRLDIEQLRISGYKASGPVNIRFQQGGTIVTPAGLVVRAPGDVAPPARANGGVVTVSGAAAAAKDLAVAFAGGEVRVSATYNWGSGAASVDASWNRLVYPAGTTHSGSLTASLEQPWPNQPVIDATVNSSGQAAGASWASKLTLGGRGRSWADIDWSFASPQLLWTQGGQTWDLSNLQANGATRGSVVSLLGLSVPPGRLYGKLQRGELGARGQYDLSSGQWYVSLFGTRWPVLADNPAAANFELNAGGDPRQTWLTQFYFEAGALQVWASGQLFQSRAGMPVEFSVFGWYPPVDYRFGRPLAPGDDLRLAGRLRSELRITKHAWPTNLDIEGYLYAKEFVLNRHPLGDVAIQVAGHAWPDRAHIGTTEFKLLSGQWDIEANLAYPKTQPRKADMSVKLSDLSLAQVDNFASPPPNIRGTLGGAWRIDVPNLDVRRMRGEGDWWIDGLARWAPPPPPNSPEPIVRGPGGAVKASYVSGSATLPTSVARAARTQPATMPSRSASAIAAAATQPAGRLIPVADRVEGSISIADGTVKIAPITMRFRQGRGNAAFSFPLEKPHQIHAEGSLAAWPIELGNSGSKATLMVWGSSRLDLDLARKAAQGPVDLSANLWIDREASAKSPARSATQPVLVAEVQAKTQVVERRIDLRTLSGQILGGKLSGDGFIYLDVPLQSTGEIRFKDMDAGRITHVWPVVSGLVGTFDGSVAFAPATGTDPAIPAGSLMIRGLTAPRNAKYRTIDLGPLSFRGHLGIQRAVLEDLKWELAGGTLAGWARSTWYGDGAPSETGETPFVHTTLRFDKLDLEQVVYAAEAAPRQHKPMPGKLSGRLFLAADPVTGTGRRQAAGDLFVRVTDSDLANNSIVNALYGLLSIKPGPLQPHGEGMARARLEGKRLEIPIVRYFNRGVDLRAGGTVENVFLGLRSPLSGTAAGTARPLKDLKLPFMADADRILRALQGNLATVRIGGELGKPQVHSIPFAEAGEAFRRFMEGQVKEETAIPGR